MSRLKILIVHNKYRQRGGEDGVVETETLLLRDFGDEVSQYFETNDAVKTLSFFQAAAGLIWSFRSQRELAALIRRIRPDVVHFHNVFYRVSPAAFWVCRRMGVPAVQTLHNFRVGCLNGRLSRNGAPCERCLTFPLWFAPGVYGHCFQDSTFRSLALAGSLAIHRVLRSYSGAVTRFIALSQFARDKHVLSGIPAERIVVKPNSAYPDPGLGNGEGDFALFAGRLEVDKGVRVLLEAAAAMGGRVQVCIAGDGALAGEVRHAAATIKGLSYLGPLPRAQVIDLMKTARLFLFPSLAYENFPLTLAEAFGVGLPAIVSRRGAAQEIVEDWVTGLHFDPGSAADLAQKTEALWNDNATLAKMRAAARAKYEMSYSGEAAYKALRAIYEQAIDCNRADAERGAVRAGTRDIA